MSEEQKTSHIKKQTTNKEQAIIGSATIGLLILFWIIANFLVGMIAAVLGGIGITKLLKQKPELKQFAPTAFMALGGLILVTIFVSVFVPAIQSDQEFREKQNAITSGTSQNYTYLTDAGTIERNIELGALEALGHDTNITKIEITEGEVWIDYIIESSLSTNSTRRGILKDTGDLVKELSSVAGQDISSIVVQPYLMLVDQYGNEKLSKVAIITIKRNTWGKINWDNFSTDNLPNVADTYWLHPALKE